MATSELEDWEMCPASLEEHVPSPIEEFPLMMFDLFSHCFTVEVLILRLLKDGTSETGKILTPKCSFQSAFLHVYMRLNDPSFAV